MHNEAILNINNIHKSFSGTPVHKGVTFQLKKGEAIGLLGGSGQGKSVLLRELIGLEYIDDGEISYRGTRLDNLEEEDLFSYRTKISYSFQSGALFDSITVFENIAFPLFEHTELTEQEISEKVNRALKVVDMDGKGDLMPSDLSGGMQKRVGLARSIILDPEIILYDEPTAGLDPVNTQNVVKIMNKLKERGISSIFVTHDIPAAIQTCDRILLLNGGKIIFEGTTDDFVNSERADVKEFFTNQVNTQKRRFKMRDE